MKLYFFTFFTFLFVTCFYGNEIKEEQVKVAYVYNFLKNISWQNEKNIDKYQLLIVSKNETLNNMFSMLGSRKQLKEKNIEVLIYDEKKSFPNIQAVFIDSSYSDIYEKLFFEYEKNNTLFISDNYEDKKQVMINLLQNESKITFEINKANILNRSLEVSPSIILLGGTEIDVAKLYKSSQDALKEQKDIVVQLNTDIKNKNIELNNKLKTIEEQKTIISTQIVDIKTHEKKIKEQTTQLSEIYNNIASQKEKLLMAVQDVKDKENIVKTLENLQQKKQEEFELAKKDLDFLNVQIEEQKDNLILKEKIISNQKNIIIIFIFLFLVIIILGFYIIRQTKLLKSLSLTDSLSGLYNRRFAISEIDKDIAKFNRYKTPISILLIDIDHFKKINDNFGHDKGDFVIKKISTLMKQSTRQTDICVRWGGEEFLIIASGSNISEANKLGEKFRKIVENSHFDIDKQVTVSIGIASYDINLGQEGLLKAADKALYKAKENGRNKVEIA